MKPHSRSNLAVRHSSSKLWVRSRAGLTFEYDVANEEAFMELCREIRADELAVLPQQAEGAGATLRLLELFIGPIDVEATPSPTPCGWRDGGDAEGSALLQGVIKAAREEKLGIGLCARTIDLPALDEREVAAVSAAVLARIMGNGRSVAPTRRLRGCLQLIIREARSFVLQVVLCFALVIVMLLLVAYLAELRI